MVPVRPYRTRSTDCLLTGIVPQIPFQLMHLALSIISAVDGNYVFSLRRHEGCCSAFHTIVGPSRSSGYIDFPGGEREPASQLRGFRSRAGQSHYNIIGRWGTYFQQAEYRGETVKAHPTTLIPSLSQDPTQRVFILATRGLPSRSRLVWWVWHRPSPSAFSNVYYDILNEFHSGIRT